MAERGCDIESYGPDASVAIVSVDDDGGLRGGFWTGS